MYQAKSAVKSSSLYWWGREGPSTKFFFPVWTCIKPNLLSKIFPFTIGGVPWQKFFFQSEHVSSQICCQKIFPLLVGGSLYKIFFSSLNMYQAKSAVKNFSLYWWGRGAPLQKFFFPVWTCIKPNLLSKILPFTGGGGGSLDKIFFSSLNMYQAKSAVKNSSLYWWGRGGPSTKFFFPVWTCIKPNLLSKILPFTIGGVPRQKFFFQSEHVSSQICCQKFFPLLWGGGPLTKFFFPVWTCIKPNLVSKIFPFTGGGEDPCTKNFFSSLNMYQAKSAVNNFSLYWWEGGSLDKIFFFQSEHVSSQICCQKFFPLPEWGGSLDKFFFFQSEHVSSQIWCQKFSLYRWRGRGPSTKNFFSSLNMYQAKSAVKFFSLYWDRVPPPSKAELGPPLPRMDWDPPHPRLDWDPPVQGWRLDWDHPPPESGQTDISKYKYYLPSYYVRGW